MLALYGSTMHVQCSYTVGPKKAINRAPLFEDIRMIFFLLSVLARLKKQKPSPNTHCTASSVVSFLKLLGIFPGK